MRQLKHPAMIVAAIALFIALGGGMAVAAGGLISGSKIKNHSIPVTKLTNSAVSALAGRAQSDFNPDEAGVSSVAYTPIASLTLTAGSYVISAHTTIRDTTENEYTTCELREQGASQLLDAGYGSTTVSAHVASVSLEAPVTTSGGTLKFQCYASADHVTTLYSHLIAIKVGTVTGS
jgi:hypothetical protein